MVEAMLIVNFEPPFIGLTQPGKGRNKSRWRNCSLEEIHSFLVELEAIASDHSWSPRDCVLRLPGNYSPATLAKFGLADVPVLNDQN